MSEHADYACSGDATTSADAATSTDVCHIENLSFSYADKPIFLHANLTVHAGEFLAIIGDNGVGKSTLMKLILGSLKPQAGHITLFGEPVVYGKAAHNRSFLRKVAYVSQNSVLAYRAFPTTIRELIEVHCRYLHCTKQVDDLLSLVQLNSHIDKRLRELSGGQLQRVGVLLALLKQAQLILLDEPTSGIDAKFSHELYGLLAQLARGGTSVVIITHHVHELHGMVDRVVELKDGAIKRPVSDTWKADECA